MFVDDLDDPRLPGSDLDHLTRSLRLRAGDALTVSDGRGRWRPCRLGSSGHPVPAGDIVSVARPVPAITVAFAPVKGDRPEWAVQKLTEIGVDHVGLLSTARSVVRWDDERGPRHLERLTRVAREAAMQSRQVWLPTVHPPQPLATAAARPGVALADARGEPPSLSHCTLLVGPEGGWTDEERALAPAVALGPGVLRAETAAVVGGALLAALRSGLVAAHDAPSGTNLPAAT